LTLLFFDFGSGEIVLIVLAIFLIFGPDKIPEMARGLGKFINEVKRASEDIKTEINREADKKEREKKLEEYKSRINQEDTGLGSQPRSSSTVNDNQGKTKDTFDNIEDKTDKKKPDNNDTQ